jgi:hypothetical protein
MSETTSAADEDAVRTDPTTSPRRMTHTADESRITCSTFGRAEFCSRLDPFGSPTWRSQGQSRRRESASTR